MYFGLPQRLGKVCIGLEEARLQLDGSHRRHRHSSNTIGTFKLWHEAKACATKTDILLLDSAKAAHWFKERVNMDATDLHGLTHTGLKCSSVIK
jgi:hypothetical protein